MIRGARILAPTGWSEVRIGFDVVDRVFAPRTFFLTYVVGLAVLPLLLAMALIYSIRGGSAVQQRVLSLIVGYNALLVVSCLTAAVVASLLILTLLRFTRILLVSIDVARAFRAVATWTGYGTASGVVTAAMLPVLNGILPLSIGTGTETDLTAIITPQLLIDIPATGAVVGYGIGLVVSVVVVCRNAENLILRRLLAPTLFVTVLVALGSNGIDPRGLSAVISRSVAISMHDDPIECSSSGTVGAFEEHLGDTPWMLHVLETCSTPFMVGGWAFVASVGAVVVFLALLSMAVDFCRSIKGASELIAVR